MGGVAEAAHTVGLTDHIRGTIAAGVDATVARDQRWALDVFTTFRGYVRFNREGEGAVRISPRQVHYPVGARLRFPIGDQPIAEAKYSWGLVAFHQSNHDVDESDPVLNRETVSYEIYGLTWWAPRLRLTGGLYYDRGTTRALKYQRLPFDYYLAGAQAEGWRPLGDHLYLRGLLELIGHRNGDHSPAYLNVNATAEIGGRWTGDGGQIRLFVRGQRLEDYRYLDDQPRHLLMLGLTLASGALAL